MSLFDPEKIKGKRFVVFGDFMLDHYRFMQPKKLSPEAPVVIFSQISEEYRLGGAGNVANNLVSLGGQVDFYSIIGYDWQAYERKVKVPFNAHLLTLPRPITVKERILTKRQQVARIDKQMTGPLNSLDVTWILSSATNSIRSADAVVISDYNHGTMVEDLALRIIALAKHLGKKVIVDSKAPDSATKYKGATMIVPNEAEACLIAGKPSFQSVTLAEGLVKTMDLEAIGITMGPKGIYLFYDGKGDLIPACLRNEDEVADVTGAGDTVLAAISAALACGADYRTATIFANEAAAQVVRKVGVATVELGQLNSERSIE